MSVKNNGIPEKRGRGRPRREGGRDPVFSVRLPRDLIAAVDSWADEHGCNRAAATRGLLERAFAAKNVTARKRTKT